MMGIRASGSRGLLVEVADTMTLVAAIENARPGCLQDYTPGARTVLLTAWTGEGLAELRAWVVSISQEANDETGTAQELLGEPVIIPVSYDGEDLQSAAEYAGIDVADLVRLHSSTIHTVAFCGFAPGFPYMTGLPEMLWLPRHRTPRTRVPAGSVAIAGCYTGIYPRESPGGWHLIGRTGVQMWRSDREPPALLTPGTRIRFQPQ